MVPSAGPAATGQITTRSQGLRLQADEQVLSVPTRYRCVCAVRKLTFCSRAMANLSAICTCLLSPRPMLSTYISKTAWAQPRGSGCPLLAREGNPIEACCCGGATKIERKPVAVGDNVVARVEISVLLVKTDDGVQDVEKESKHICPG
jgi:hypothetical protein